MVPDSSRVGPPADPAFPRPVVVGEVLFDVFPDGREVLGGAPFNVAWSLRGFGLDPLVIARVGRDARGDRALAAMAAWGLDASGIQVDPTRPTGVVRVTDADRGPAYDIAPGQAWDALDDHAAQESVRGVRASVLYRGTLCARSPASRHAIARLHARLAVATFLDVNLRAPWWDLALVREALDAATIAKMNDDELRSIAGVGDPAAAAGRLRIRHGLDAILVTRGDAGATWIDGQGTHAIDAARPRVLADTVGAGDAFAAVAIVGLTRGWPATRTLRRAAEFAAAACGWRGATTDDPTPYRGRRERWTAEDAEEDSRG